MVDIDRSKLNYTIKTDIFAPNYLKTIQFEGPHPSRLLKILPDNLMDFFRIESPGMYADQIKWDDSGDPIVFNGVWRGKAISPDRFTSLWVQISVDGTQNIKDRYGKATVAIRGITETKFPSPTRAHYYTNKLYMATFYADRRQKLIESSRKLLLEYDEEIKRILGLLEKSGVRR